MGFFGHSDDAKNTMNYNNISLLKKAKHAIELVFLIVFYMGLSVFGHRINIYIYRFLFKLLSYIPVLNHRAYVNLKRAYPDKSEKQLLDLSRQTWQNLADVVVDFLFAKSFFQKKNFYQIENLDIIIGLQKNHKSILFVSGHIATWEIFRIAMAHYQIPVGMMYRAFNNPYFDNIARYIMDYGIAPIFQKGTKGIKNMMRYLRNGGNVLILMDQHFSSGHDIPFFNHDAKTSPSAAELSLKYNIPMVPVFVRRDGIGKFIITIHPPLVPDADITDTKNKITNLLIKMNRVLENHIRHYPAEWFWLHRRWK